MRSPQAASMIRWGCLLLLAAARAEAQSPPMAESGDPEEAREREVAERFLAVLERNPRRGTALDKIYAFHGEHGSLDAFVAQLRDRVARAPDDGTGWMILGLVESQRSRDVAAVEALNKAAELRATDPLAAYYRGQALIVAGQADKAVAALEEAIRRNPSPTDGMEIFQTLARVHQRAGRTKEALEVWGRLEKLFPGNWRVQEQIALSLVEEGQYLEALPRYEFLASAIADDYRRTAFRMEVADLKVKLARTSEGLADFEQLLATLNPESWLYREVRRKIEEVFLRGGDEDGLAKYYAAWLAKNPDDIEAMSRLARVLAHQSRTPEAQEWLAKAIKLAPSRKELRLALIQQLVDDQRYGEAVAQYRELAKIDPNNPDHLREWGKLILRDPSLAMDKRRAEAERIWKQIQTFRPDDPLVATQVADLFRHAEMQPQALANYQHAVELAPSSPQYREYLGEYYHVLKRPADALATWGKMAEGELRNATNLARLAEVLAQFGYVKEALPQIVAACELEPKDFALLLKAADLQLRGGQNDVALQSLSRADALTQNDEEREVVLKQQIKIFMLQNALVQQAASLAQLAGSESTPRRFYLLARYREALGDFRGANQAIRRAFELQPGHIPTLAAAARIAEQAGELATAVEQHRKLASVDRRGRSQYLQHIADLEAKLGRAEEALAAGRELLAAAPGNAENYEFFASLCFRLRRTEDGFAALRRAVGMNPNDSGLLLSLAAALTAHARVSEAIDVYWQAFEKATDLDDKLGIIGKLTDLHQQAGRLDQLLARLERRRRESELRREMTICIAQAFQSAGEMAKARQELEGLLNEATRDTQLLLQLSRLAEGESDWAAAVKYQRQLSELAPGGETEYRLATLLSRAGENQEAAAILVRLTSSEENRGKLVRNIDSLLATNQGDTALAILEPKLRQDPADWELLYRQGLILVKRDPDAAAARFQSILDLSLPDDEVGTAGKNRQRNAPSALPSSMAAAMASANPSRLATAQMVPLIVGIQRPSAASASQFTNWRPQDFGQARMAAIGWLYGLAANENRLPQFVEQFRRPAEAAEATPRELWDLVYVQAIQQNMANIRQTARRLAEKGGRPEQLLYLELLTSGANRQIVTIVNGAAVRRSSSTEPSFSIEELDVAVRSYRAIRDGENNALAGTSSLSPATAFTLLSYLNRAGRTDEARELYRQELKRAETTKAYWWGMQLASLQADRSALLAMFDRLAADETQSPQAIASGQTPELPAMLISAEMAKPGSQTDEMLAIWDRYLTYHAAKNNRRLRDNPLAPVSAASRIVAGRTLIPVLQNGRIIYAVSGAANSQRTNLSVVAPNRYFDTSCIQVLGTAFDTLGRNRTDKLINHLSTQLDQGAASQKIYVLLALAYVHAWNSDLEAALKSVIEAADLAPQDVELRLTSARLQMELRHYDEAFQVADSLTPLDQKALQERETIVLQVALELGKEERAREAAQRLFGMRLDAPTQLTLAGQMRRLGMTEEADQVLARWGGATTVQSLAAIMQQHLAQGRKDQAADAAQLILSRTRSVAPRSVAIRSTGAGAPPARSPQTDARYRQAALSCLKQTGKLNELVANTEQQIARSGGSTALYETLSEFYQAAGEAEKAFALQAILIDLRPDDVESRLRFAQQLVARRKYAEACEHYGVVVKKHPRDIGTRYTDIVQAFQRAGQESQLAECLMGIELKSLGPPQVVTEWIRDLMRTPRGSAAGTELFGKAWEAYPAERSRLLANFHNNQAWKRPEMFELAKRSVIPNDDDALRDAWHGIVSGPVSVDPRGVIKSMLSDILVTATLADQLGNLRAGVASAAAADPAWLAGPVLLAIIDARLGKTAEASDRVKPLLDAAGNDVRLRNARWIVAQEIEHNSGLRELAIQLYRRALQSDEALSFAFSPSRRLANLLTEVGRPEEARQVLLEAAQEESGRAEDRASYVAQRAGNLLAIGELLNGINFPADALRIYRELIRRSARGVSSIGIVTDDYRRRAEVNLHAILRTFANKPNVEVALALLAAADAPARGSSAIDLMVSTVGGRGVVPVIDSPFAKIVQPGHLDAEDVRRVAAQLQTLEKQYPQDLSVAIAVALFAVQGEDAAKANDAVSRLLALAQESSSDSSAAERTRIAQSNQTADQLDLWLVARECLPRQVYRSMGQKLAELAIAAAEQRGDLATVTAILFERGRLDLAAGDRDGVEQGWNDLIDQAVVGTRKQAAGEMPTSHATQSQFQLAVWLSLAAAENDLSGLSLRAIREGLSGGMPIPDLPTAQAALSIGSPAALKRYSVFNNPPSSSSATPVRPPNAGSTIPAPPTRAVAPGALFSSGAIPGRLSGSQRMQGEVADALWQLSAVWQKRNFPPQEVCKLLEGIVFPENRPEEIFLCEGPVGRDLASAPSVGRALAQWAVHANRTAEFQKQIAARQSGTAHEMAGKVLEVQLAVAAGQPLEAKAHLQAINQQLLGHKLPSLADLATHAVAAALDEPQLTSETMALIDLLIPMVGREAVPAFRAARQRLSAPSESQGATPSPP